LEVGRKNRTCLCQRREEVLFGQIPFILPDVHVVKLCCIAGFASRFFSATFMLARILWTCKETKIVLRLHSSKLNQPFKAVNRLIPLPSIAQRSKLVIFLVAVWIFAFPLLSAHWWSRCSDQRLSTSRQVLLPR
jgi:hypothetical protein